MIKIAFLPYENEGKKVDIQGGAAASFTHQPSGSPRREHRVDLRGFWANFTALSPTVTRYLTLYNKQNEMIWRSGKTTLSEPSNMYILIAETVELPESEMKDMLPSLPITQGDATIKTLKLDLQKGKVAVSGSGTYDTWIDVDYDFTYSFRLNPYQDVAKTDRILSVNTVDGVDVKGKGIFGWLVSFIANFMEDDFTKDIEKTLQQEIDKAVDGEIEKLVKEQLDGERPEGITVTVTSVEISSEKVVVEVVAGVPASALDCGSHLNNRGLQAAEEVPVGTRSLREVNELRKLRDDILDPSESGQAYRRLYDTHKEEILNILIAQPQLLSGSDMAITGILKDFRDGDGRLSEATAGAVENLLGEVRGFASQSLQEAIDEVAQKVGDFVNKPPKDVLGK
jgi:hypothetical protein